MRYLGRPKNLWSCCLVLMSACGLSPADTDDSTTLTLERQQDGSFQGCDAAGNCQNLPSNDGIAECVLLEIRVDLATGQTCQTCTLADGTAIDMGCDASVVACAWVTIPEPDCLVCAYVNGSVIYSTCTPEDPMPSPCDLVRCEAGTHCEEQEVWCITYPCPPQAVCVPDDIRCTSDADCAPGDTCIYDACTEMACPDDRPDCNTCWGHCEPTWYDPCATVLCLEGYQCIAEYVDCFTEPCLPVPTCIPVGPFNCDDSQIACDMAPPQCPPGEVPSIEGACYGPCVPEYTCFPRHECNDDTQCAAGEQCQFICVDCMAGDPNCIGGCFGQCVPTGETCGDQICSPGTTCQAECWPCADGFCEDNCAYWCAPIEPDPCALIDCAPGYVCELQEVWCITEPCPPQPTCVPVGPFDCDLSHILCDMVEPQCPAGEVPSVSGSCYGPCVPAELCGPDTGCQDDSECAPGEACFMACPMCTPDTPPEWCTCFGYCAPVQQNDCFATGCSGQVCSDTDVYTTCEWREEYACYWSAICERGADGACGWRETPELRECLAAGGP